MQHFKPETFVALGSIGHLLGLTNQYKDRLIDGLLVEEEITAAQFKVVLMIGKGWADTPMDLCRALSIDSGSVSRMLDRLQRKGLIERQRGERDRRTIRLALTESGRILFARLPEIAAHASNQLVGCLEATELDTLQALLRKILAASDRPYALQSVACS
ncbi:MarR family winged helix-turn-helix transcriptional regulator [Pseudomonas matsuisoli]|uniref:MarR family transcriptional regulator n=1 Tax=Pseudomonas matsuisoli TaxID=1515666 RepID=A0A917PLS9_9PSED|nr:MarR family transcriptional regulator [Pseudomonas matsuisoli]GGJ83718.1 MarR family transcriptional regulator [Pseudomonas matsuisoli]